MHETPRTGITRFYRAELLSLFWTHDGRRPAPLIRKLIKVKLLSFTRQLSPYVYIFSQPGVLLILLFQISVTRVASAWYTVRRIHLPFFSRSNRPKLPIYILSYVQKVKKLISVLEK